MSNVVTDEFADKSLKSYFRKNRCYDADELYGLIIENKESFEKLLDRNQRIEFVKLWGMLDRYCLLINQDSFSDGFFSGIGWESIDISD